MRNVRPLVMRWPAAAPRQLTRSASRVSIQILRSLTELPGAIVRRSGKAAAGAASGAATAADWTAQALHDGPHVAASWIGTLWDWFVHVNRNRIIQLARDRYPDEFAQLEGGDVRLLDSFLDPNPLSNTVSLLGWPLDLRWPSPDSELHLGLEPWNAVAFLQDTGGPLAPYGNSAVLGDGREAERWFFLNGILTDRQLALRNAARLRDLLDRDVVTIYDSTQGLIPDLVASALQKFTNIHTEPVAFALIQIGKALLDPAVRRVAVVAHSRGTIVTGDVLDLVYCAIDPKYLDRTNMNARDLETFQERSFKTAQAYEVQSVLRELKGREDVVEKLELYMFANAASKMCYLDKRRRIPHLESFANEHDIVARLGCLARDEFHAQRLLRIDGPVYLRRGAYGHLLNAHYLREIAAGVYEPLQAPEGPAPCVGDFVHQRVAANPCARNGSWIPGPPDAPSRFVEYVREAAAQRITRGRARAAGARRRSRRPRGEVSLSVNRRA